METVQLLVNLLNVSYVFRKVIQKKYCKTVTPPLINFVNADSSKSSYIKMVKINDNQDSIQGLVDTGYDVSLIKSSVAKQLNLNVSPTTRQLSVYGNNSINVVSGFTSVTLKIDDVLEVVDLLQIAIMSLLLKLKMK